MRMGLKALIAVGVVSGLVVGTILRYTDWSEEFSYLFSLGMLAVVLLACFPFFDPERDFGGGSRKR